MCTRMPCLQKYGKVRQDVQEKPLTKTAKLLCNTQNKFIKDFLATLTLSITDKNGIDRPIYCL